MHHILLVEDEKDTSDLIIDILEKKGYKVTAAYKGKEALVSLEKEKFELIIIDLLLPDMNGINLCGIIRHDIRYKTLPIIISTGLNDEYNKNICEKFGITEFLGKPYSMEDLLSAVKRCLS